MQQQWGDGGGVNEQAPHQVKHANAYVEPADLTLRDGNMESQCKQKIYIKT